MYTKEDYFKIQDAIKFLVVSFEYVEDRNKPELVHSLHVGYRLMDYYYPLDVVIAGFLHDILEEGEFGKEIKEKFGQVVYDLVDVNTKDKSINGWQAQYAELLPRVAQHGMDALVVKAADILDNFVYAFQIDNELTKQKVLLLADELFRQTDLEEGVFGELRKVYADLVVKI